MHLRGNSHQRRKQRRARLRWSALGVALHEVSASASVVAGRLREVAISAKDFSDMGLVPYLEGCAPRGADKTTEARKRLE